MVLLISLLILLNPLACLSVFWYPQNSQAQDSSSRFYLDASYDFIIIGSGSSGAVLAKRLSEILNWKILLLEAGTRGNFLTTVPVLAPLFQLTPYNWNYTMEHQPGFCMSMIDEICAWPKGKALGGTSVINYMIYTRGNPKDYEKWSNLGVNGWSYKDVLPYFKKSEHCNLNGGICQNGYHNQSGLLSVEHPFKTEITDIFLKAGTDLSEKIVDYNSDDYMGFSQIQANQKRGKRHSVATAFLENSGTNLKIVTSARVDKILINSNRAYGVTFQKLEHTFTVRATKEVIVSAGTLSSPQLLMLSGIGPEDHLKDLGIPLIKNLPVGQLLYDHIAYLGLAFKINRWIEPRYQGLNPTESLNWIFNGTGFFTSLAGVEALAYINTGFSQEANYPDIELILAGTGSLESDLGLVVAPGIRVTPDVYDTVFRPLELVPTFSVIPMLLHPESSGFMKLRSTNIMDPPKFYGNHFSDPQDRDIKTFLASIRYIQKLIETPTFQKIGATIHDVPIPGCEKYVFDSDEYWFCALRSLTSTLHHQIGTCRMGVKEDKGAVVDEKLRVIGVDGLRVVDASIIPVTLSAHTNAPSIMIGEKAADIIKKDWGVI